MSCKPVETLKKKHRKGLWSPEEDESLRNYILEHGHVCWTSVPMKAGLKRNGKSCRLRWMNHLRPGLRRDTFTSEEEDIILRLHSTFGNKWSHIAQYLSGRTDNEIKNHWHSCLRKKTMKVEESTNSNNGLGKSYSNSYDLVDRDMHNTNGQSLKNSITRASSFESTTSTLQIDDVLTIYNCSNTKPMPRLDPQRSFLPYKVVFADWLTMDGHSTNTSNGENVAPLVNQSINTYVYDIPFSSVVQQASLHSEFGYNNIVSYDDAIDHFDKPLNIEQQAPSFGFDEFLYYGEEICSGLKMPYDNVVHPSF